MPSGRGSLDDPQASDEPSDVTLAGGAGRALRGLDLVCGWLYVLGALSVGGALAWSAITETAWVWLLAGPVLATAALFGVGLLQNPERGLHLALPRRRRRR